MILKPNIMNFVGNLFLPRSWFVYGRIFIALLQILLGFLKRLLNCFGVFSWGRVVGGLKKSRLAIVV